MSVQPTTRESRPSGEWDRKDPRKPFQIDRDRILYSNAFRRLAGVTQVVSPGEGEIFHNRLTHSLKVAQIARRIAETFCETQSALVEAWGGLDPEVCEAAALAHDLGHPPFGHVAEHELQQLVACATNTGAASNAVEGYEGNAQSFRIITELSTRRKDCGFGLDLTRATLNATLKYPWKHGGNHSKPHKYGAYNCDDDAFQFARAGSNPAKPIERSLEAQIMDWADDITYSIHDTEDFYRAGFIPLDRLADTGKEQAKFRASIRNRRGTSLNMDAEFDSVFIGFFDSLGIRERYEGTREQQQTLYAFVSRKIAEYVRATQLIAPSTGGEALQIPKALKTEVDLLKELTWTYVIENPALAAHQHGQRKAVRTLFEILDEKAAAGEWILFPASFRERGRDLTSKYGSSLPLLVRVRLVADTIATMTDKQALIIYHQFTGVSPSSMLDPVMA